jgi:hypothetical protein
MTFRGPPPFSPPEFAFSVRSLLNNHDSDSSSSSPGPSNPYDPGPSNPYDPGPGEPRKPLPRKPLPQWFLAQMDPDELQRYNRMPYSKQEGYVAQLLVRQKRFCVEESRSWRAFLALNSGKPPTSKQVRHFLEYLEHCWGMKIAREDKRYRDNGMMWLEENWDAIAPFVPMVSCIPRD